MKEISYGGFVWKPVSGDLSEKNDEEQKRGKHIWIFQIGETKKVFGKR